MGTFVAQLGVDLLLGRLVGLASMFGCLPEVSGRGLTATSAFSLLPPTTASQVFTIVCAASFFSPRELNLSSNHLFLSPTHLPKALAMAAVLNCQRSPFRIASPLGE